jgi:membrane protein
MMEHGIDPRLLRLRKFLFHVLLRFRDDGCLAAAGALSYTTLVSMVPLVVISLAVLSAFPIFDTLRSQLLGFVFDAFVPSIGGTVEQYISSFAASAGRTTAVGLVLLAFTSITLLATIEDRLDSIWRVYVPRRWVTRVTVYWTVLTLGPLLFGLAFSLSGDLSTVSQMLGLSEESAPAIGRGLHSLTLIVPLILETLGLMLFFCLIPNCPVRWRDGLLGGFVAAALLEICKAGFTIFVGHYSSYEAVYGALAVIPTFLLWMYLSWSVVLFGAEIAAAVPLWGIDEALGQAADLPDLELALYLLDALAAQARSGGAARMRNLARAARVPAGIVGHCLDLLSRSGFVAATADGGFVLARDLDAVSLLDLQHVLEPHATPRLRSTGSALARLDERFAAVRRAEADALSVSVASVLGVGNYVGVERTE